jgi:hypothetical protein
VSGACRLGAAHRRAVLLLALALSLGCDGRGRELPPGVIARVGERDLTWSELVSYVERSVGEPIASLDSAALAALFDDFVEEELLRTLALERGVVSAGASRARAAQALLAEERERPIPSDELAAYYLENLDLLRRPERLRVRQVLFEERVAAEGARNALRRGDEDIELDSGRTVDLGELSYDDLPKDVAQQLFALEPPGISEVVEVGGIHSIFVVEERLPAETPPLERIAEELAEQLRAERTAGARERLLAQARERYNVEIAASRLPFPLEAAADGATAAGD